MQSDRAAMQADPIFKAGAEHARKAEAARVAGVTAAAPFDAALAELLAAHPDGFERGSDTEQRIESVQSERRDAIDAAYARHGFSREKAPASLAELRARLSCFDDPDSMMARIEQATGKRLRDVWKRESLALWKHAERFRARTPSCPPLPHRPRRGRDRLLLLKAWCESASSLPREARWVRADEAVKASGLSPGAISKRSKREGWGTRKSGRMNVYPLARLLQAWPHRRFERTE